MFFWWFTLRRSQEWQRQQERGKRWGQHLLLIKLEARPFRSDLKVKVMIDQGLKSKNDSESVQICLFISEPATYIRLKSNRGKQSKGLVLKEEWGYVIAIDSTGYKTRIVLPRFWWIPSLQAQAADSLSQKSHFRPQAPIPGRALPPAWWHRPPRPDPVTRPHLLCRHRPDQAQPQRLLRQTNAGTFNLQTHFSSGTWKCPEQTATYSYGIN